MKYFLFLAVAFLLVASAGQLRCQTTNAGTIKGEVKDDSTGLPLEFVSVALYRTKDSTIATGMMTIFDGTFALKNIPAGKYFVRFSIVGYAEKDTKSFVIDSLHEHLNVGTVALSVSSVKLNEVVITGERSLFTNAADRKIYNVGQDIMSKTGSASELLQKVPSVQVDIDGNVSLRGSTGVQIMVNGKPSPLMDRNSAEVLQQMPANSIERIEVITNPSAKYNPEGTAGIINIVMKKNTGLGLNGDISANVGNAGRYNGGIRMNYNPGDLNFFLGYTIRKDNRNRTTSDTRTQTPTDSSVSYYQGDLYSDAAPLSNIAEGGVEYHPDAKNQLGVSGNFFINTFTRNDDQHVTVRDEAATITQSYARNRYDPEYEKEYEISFFAEHDFSPEDHTLRLEFHDSHSPEQEDNHFTNTYDIPPAGPSYDNTLIYQNEHRNQLSLDYSNKLSESVKLEAGYAGQFGKSDFDFYAEAYDDTLGAFVKDSLKSNQFRYNEKINALYATFEQSFGEFGLDAGLRAERADIESNLITLDTVVQTNYFNLFPSLHLSYKMSEEAELRLSYSRRIHRPNGDDLNPFPEYRDPRNLSAGNPYLMPEYINSLEFGCQFDVDPVSILPSLYYRNTYNKFTSVIVPINDSTLLTTRQNLATDQTGGLELIVSADIGKFLSAHWSANGYYERIDATNLGFSDNKSTMTYSSNLTLNFNITETSKLQINTNYNSRRLTPQGEFVPTYQVNMGFRQVLLEGKLTLIGTISDIFKTQKRQLELNTPILDQTVITTRDSRIAYIGLTYHFGFLGKKSEEEQMRFESAD